MSVSERNRNANYNEIKPELGCRQSQVFDLLQSNPSGLTRHEIALQLNLPINSVTGRVKELETMRLIEESGETRLTQYGKSAAVMRVKQKPAAKVEQQYFW